MLCKVVIKTEDPVTPTIELEGAEEVMKVLDYQWFRKRPVNVMAVEITGVFTVHTKEGVMEGKAGDYLVIGEEEELYPVDKEIFKKTYEEPR